MASFTKSDAIYIFVSIVLYLADVSTDIILGVRYFKQGDTLWCTMTFIFVFVPVLIIQILSLILLRKRHFGSAEISNDHDDRMGGWWSSLEGCRETFYWWFNMVTVHILLLGPVLNYIRVLRLGLTSRHGNEDDYTQMMRDYMWMKRMSIVEAFMESAPQLTLQVYIMMTTGEFLPLTVSCALVSLCSLAWTLESYYKYDQIDANEDRVTNGCGMAFRIGWRLLTLSARVIAFSLFALVYKWWVFVVAGVHWTIIIACLVLQEMKRNQWEGCFSLSWKKATVGAVLGVIHIFCFLDTKPLAAFFRVRLIYLAIPFYIFMFIENSVMYWLWYPQQESLGMYRLIPLSFIWGGFFLGLLLIVLYYLYPSLSRNVHSQDSEWPFLIDQFSDYQSTTQA